MSNTLRSIPSVEVAVQALAAEDLPRPLVVATVRRELDAVRELEPVPLREQIMQRLAERVEELRAIRLQPLINATGIPLHTNFGRAPLSETALAALEAVARGYSNLEYDLRTGKRGRRGEYAEMCLALLCEAEAAAVVNNCAAALVLMLHHLTRTKREVIISRGELVQIGGGFRVPEILEAAGARLREVGTTNRTSIDDYARAMGADTALILKVHQSNFYMGGFVETVATEELARLAAAAQVPLIEDLGSGAIADTETVPGLQHERVPAESLRAGVDLVCFSGDKLFGGPQAGIIAGRAELVAALKKDPLFRAFRCDKLILAALERTAEAHLSSQAWREIPTLEMLARHGESLRVRGEAIASGLAGTPVSVSIEEVESEVGAGTLPRSVLGSVALALRPPGGKVQHLADALRQHSPPLIGYISEDRLVLDLRTVAPENDSVILKAIQAALGHL